jgi:FkbM family methyltransferase
MLPGGLRLKLSQPAFYWGDFQMVLGLRAAQIEPKTIFDVGANRGQFGLAAAAAYPQAEIHCYEPLPRPYKELARAFRSNPRVHCHPLALADRQGTAQIRVASQDQSSSLLPMHANHHRAYPHITEGEPTEISLTTLEDEIQRIQPVGPILLKIDTQGYEWPVIQGAGAAISKIQWLLLETSTQPMYEGEVLFEELGQRLSGLGFRFLFPAEIHRNLEGAPDQFDALFARESSC